MDMAYQFTNLGFCYDKEPVLDIKQGMIKAGLNTALLGANGSGKTTLFNLLSLLQLPSSGQLYFFNEEIKQTNIKRLRLQIAYVQQKPFLFNFTVRENIELPLKLRGIAKPERHKQSDAIMTRLSISELAEKSAQALSGGESQKVALARALIYEPKVLILDEPFTHLDKKTADFLESLILDIKNDANISLIFSSHDHLKAHYLADEVFNIIEGHLIPSAMMNLFHGMLEQEHAVFNTGKIRIIVPEHSDVTEHLAVDSKQLVLSKARLQSSMRNQFEGRVVAMNEHEDQVRISIDAGETFEAVITHAALRELNLHMGDKAWVSFKSSAVSLF